jgi:predicted AAA+ superfamily ATPase
MPYRHRALESRLKRYLALFPAIAITGPRQSGKSTLLQTAFPDLPYVTFDDPEEVRAADMDPQGFLSRFPGRVILDEAQRRRAQVLAAVVQFSNSGVQRSDFLQYL